MDLEEVRVLELIDEYMLIVISEGFTDIVAFIQDAIGEFEHIGEVDRVIISEFIVVEVIKFREDDVIRSVLRMIREFTFVEDILSRFSSIFVEGDSF